jgi:hypothetical protein
MLSDVSNLWVRMLSRGLTSLISLLILDNVTES